MNTQEPGPLLICGAGASLHLPRVKERVRMRRWLEYVVACGFGGYFHYNNISAGYLGLDRVRANQFAPEIRITTKNNLRHRVSPSLVLNVSYQCQPTSRCLDRLSCLARGDVVETGVVLWRWWSSFSDLSEWTL